jgi:hypothetical protein
LGEEGGDDFVAELAQDLPDDPKLLEELRVLGYVK